MVHGWSLSRSLVRRCASNVLSIMLYNLDKLEALSRECDHFQQQPAVCPAVNICGAVGTLAISYRQISNLQIQSHSAKNQVEIAKRVEVAEVSTIGGDGLVVPFP